MMPPTDRQNKLLNPSSAVTGNQNKRKRLFSALSYQTLLKKARQVDVNDPK